MPGKETKMKKRLLLCLWVAFMLFTLSGCGHKLELRNDTVVIEAGEEAVIRTSDFLSGDKDAIAESELEIRDLSTSKIGTYKGTIKYKMKKYDIKVLVKDTTAPKYQLEQNIIFNKEKINVGELVFRGQDFSDTKEGILSVTPIAKPENIEFTKWVFPYNLKETDKVTGKTEQFKESDLKQTVKIESDGYYDIKIGVTDVYKNQATYDIYIAVDNEKPQITFENEDLILEWVNGSIANISSINNFTVKDIVDGDLTKKTKVSYDKDFSKYKNKLSVLYTVKDSSGNQMKYTKMYTVVDKTKNPSEQDNTADCLENDTVE